MPPKIGKEMRVSQVRQWVIRADLNSALELLFRCCPVPLEEVLDITEGVVCFSQVIIDLKRLKSRLLRLWESLTRRHIAHNGQCSVAICDACIRKRISRVAVQSALEIFGCFGSRLICSLVPEEAALQIELIRLRIGRITPRQLLFLFSRENRD